MPKKEEADDKNNEVVKVTVRVHHGVWKRIHLLAINDDLDLQTMVQKILREYAERRIKDVRF